MAFEGEDARRWALTDAPTLQPAVDFITKSPNGPFIDTGFDVRFEQRGRVYLSVETIREMAEVAGLLETKNAEEENLHEIAIYNRGYEAGLHESEELLGKLSAVAGRLSTSRFASVVSNVEIVEDDEADAGNESGVADSDSGNVQGSASRKRK